MAFKKWTAAHSHLKPDARYNSILVEKFINCFMLSGQKATASRVVYRALDIIKEKVKDTEPVEVFTTAIENVKPHIEVRSKRVGGATYQVPMQVNQKRRLSLAIRWLREATRGVKGKPMAEKLAAEAPGRLQEGRHGHPDARERASHGRGQQGVRALRVVMCRYSRSLAASRRRARNVVLARRQSDALAFGSWLSVVIQEV